MNNTTNNTTYNTAYNTTYNTTNNITNEIINETANVVVNEINTPKYDFRYNNELTKYPKLYEMTLWGSIKYDREPIIINTRNTFPLIHKIKSHDSKSLISAAVLTSWEFKNKYPESFWDLYGSPESYFDNKNRVVLVISPYNPSEFHILWLKKKGWKPCGHMMYDKYVSFVKKVDISYINNIYMKYNEHLRRENEKFEKRQRMFEEDMRMTYQYNK
jgi:hypothetical protein